MSGYSSFAGVYDRLMNDVDYKALCDKALLLCKKYSHIPHLVLDAACGTGSFTAQLERHGLEVIGTDISQEMLSIARNKLSSECVLLCQPLESLDLYGTVDTVFCTLDSLNHITDSDELLRSLKRISLFLEKGGLFVFDVNTVYKHETVLCNNIFVEDESNIYLVWQNTLYENSVVNINLDFFVKNGGTYNRMSENFDERAYSEVELENMLLDAGFEILEKTDFSSGEDPTETSEKIIYIVRKA